MGAVEMTREEVTGLIVEAVKAAMVGGDAGGGVATGGNNQPQDKGGAVAGVVPDVGHHVEVRGQMDEPTAKDLAAGLIGYMARGKNPERARALAARELGDSHPLVRAMTISDEEGGGFLVPEQVSEEIIGILTPKTVVRSMVGPNVIQMGETFRQPAMAGGMGFSYVGETQPLPLTAPGTSEIVMRARKLGGVIPISGDLARAWNARSANMIMELATNGMAVTEDGNFLRGPGTEFSPLGIEKQALASQKFTANSTVNITNVKKDLGKAIYLMELANIPMIRPAWVISPRTKYYLNTAVNANEIPVWAPEMEKGTIQGIPFKTTTQIPSNLGTGGDESKVLLVDFAEVLIGDNLKMLISTSDEAAYEVGGEVRSSFQRDMTLIRILTKHDIAMFHREGVVVIDGVKWTA